MPRLLDVADLRAASDDDRLTLTPGGALRSAATAAVLASAIVAALLAAPAVALASDPTPAPDATQRPPSCSERFPEDGPAGVDLRLGCIVSEVVGLYTAGQQGPPPTLSTYVITLVAVVLGGLFAAVLLGRALRRRAGQRLAPVLAGEWWVCARCHSVNGAGVAHCYSCGASPPDGPVLRTSDAPATPQSFGSTRKRG